MHFERIDYRQPYTFLSRLCEILKPFRSSAQHLGILKILDTALVLRFVMCGENWIHLCVLFYFSRVHPRGPYYLHSATTTAGG